MKSTGSGFVAKAILSIAAVAAMATAAAQGKPFDGVTLKVGTYGGGWKDAVHAAAGAKVEAMGAKVEYVLGNPAENFSKIVAARGRAVPVDVLELDPPTRVIMSKNGFLETLPVASIPNLAKVSVKPADGTAISHQLVELGILYRADKFKSENLPLPKRFEDLADARYQNRIAFPDVTNGQHWPTVASLAVNHGGSESNPEPGFEEIRKIKPNYFYNAATELAQKVSLGDIVAAPWHVGMAVRLANSGQDIGFVHPMIGDKRGEVEYNYLAIVKGSKNVAAAAAFINAFLEVQTQADFSKAMGVVPVSPEARAILMKDPVASKYMLLSEKDLANTYTMDWSKVDVEKWRSDWTRTVSSK